MSSALLEKARERGRWLTSRPFARALILVYHRVVKRESDPWALAVSPQRFDDHLALLGRHCRPLSLRQLTDGVKGARVPDGGVVITFDDGYADNLLQADPILERYGIPATLFVSTGALEDPRSFWWDELDRLILSASTLPPELALQIGDRHLRWSAAVQAGGASRHDASTRDWKGWEPPVTPRQRLYHMLWQEVRELPGDERYQFLDRLADRTGRDAGTIAADRPLTEDELVQLARTGRWEIGAHTVRHPKLTALPEAQQRREITRSRDTLQKLLGGKVSYFAYPFGGREDYGAGAVRLVREAGFEAACSVAAAPVTRFSRRYELPRIYAQNWSAEQLGRILHYWLGVPAA